MRKAVIQYKKASTQTTSRGKLLLMLYDGAIRFLEQACVAIDDKRPDLRGSRISKAHAIISELNATLNHKVAPELCERLAALYRFMLDELVQANRHNDPKKIKTVIELLADLREGWRGAVLADDGAAVASEAPATTSMKINQPDSLKSRPRLTISG